MSKTNEMDGKRIIIANDQGGYHLKIALVNHLNGKGYTIEDVGSHSEDIVRYHTMMIVLFLLSRLCNI